MPFGLLLCAVLAGPVLLRPLLATLAGASLSLVLEVGQTYLPGRTSSPIDLTLNATGTLLGALVATSMSRLWLVRDLMAWLQASLREPGLGRLGLTALALWALSQWIPFVPSLDIGNLRGGLAPLRATLVGAEPLAGARLTSYVLMLLGVGAVAVATLATGMGPWRLVGRGPARRTAAQSSPFSAGCCPVRRYWRSPA